MPETEKRKETKAEKKERKRLKKLKKEAKKNKKRKLEELQNGATEEMEVETPKAKKMKLSDDEKEEVNFDEINKAIIKASKDQLQNAVLNVAKSSPSEISTIETYLGCPEIDAATKAILWAPSPGKVAGVVRMWRHEKGYGFIARDDGKGELFVHVRSCYVDPATGNRNLKVGSHVEFDVEKSATDETKEQATEVCGIGGGYPEGGLQMEGTVASWNTEREFGFITGDDGNDYFAGNREVWIGSATLTKGQRVQFDIKVREDGRTMATYINEVGGVYDENCWDKWAAEQEQLQAQPGQDASGYEGQDAQSGTTQTAGATTAGAATAGAPTAAGDATDATPATPTEGKTTGVVIRWKHDKGFGFIKPDDGEDLFVHIKDCWIDKSGGHNNLKVGSRVEFDVKPSPYDPTKKQAAEVAGIGGGNAPSGIQMEGTVANWLADREFGFITGDDGNEHFAPVREVWIASGVLTPGERVQFDIKTKSDGRTAAVFVNTIGGSYDASAWDQPAAAEGDEQTAE